VDETTSLDSLTIRDKLDKLDKLKKLYRLLQTVLWLREGLDASLQATTLVIEHYREGIFPAIQTMNGQNVLGELMYRREMFRATQLRLIALHGRLETINHIVSLLATSPIEISNPYRFDMKGIRDLYQELLTDLSVL